MIPEPKESFVKYGMAISAAMLLVVGFYVGKFWTSPISGDPAHWGQIGDYVGGILNPAIGVLNIYVFWKLTQELASLERNGQKRQEQFFYNQLRMNALYEFTHETGKLSKIRVADMPLQPELLEDFASFLHSFELKHALIFPCLKTKGVILGIFDPINYNISKLRDQKFAEGEVGVTEYFQLITALTRLHKELEREIVGSVID